MGVNRSRMPFPRLAFNPGSVPRIHAPSLNTIPTWRYALMRFITAAAIKRRSVTLLAAAIVLIAGVFTYNSLRVELFPEIDFPLVVVATTYPSADAEGVVQDVTAPIEAAILGSSGLETIQSTSFEGNSIVLATFVYGTDMANAESNIETALNALTFPAGVEEPEVGRFSPDQIPVIQFAVLSEQGPEIVAPLVESQILPRLEEIDGVLQVRASGEIQRQVVVSVDPSALESRGISLDQVTRALEDNNLALPTGLVFEEGRALPVRSGHRLASVEDIRNLAVAPDTWLEDVAQVTLTEGAPASISRTNGRPSHRRFRPEGSGGQHHRSDRSRPRSVGLHNQPSPRR